MWHPSSPISLFIESMSLRRGTLCSVVLPSASRHAARIGSAEFLDPEISILPLRRFPPRRRKQSMMPIHGSDYHDSFAIIGCPKGATDSARKDAPPPFGISTSPLADIKFAKCTGKARFIGTKRLQEAICEMADILPRHKRVSR